MTRDTPSRRDLLFDAALERPPEARRAFLSEACPDDPALAAELASLLDAHASAEAFFEGLQEAVVRPLGRGAVAPVVAAGLESWAGSGTGAPSGGPGDAAGTGDLPPGTRIGRYRVDGVLGRGGMGIVYRARDLPLERDVALKLLPGERIGDPESRAALLAEARMAAGLDHPNVGVVHEVDEALGEGVFIAMACHEGITLAERLRRAPLPLPGTEALRIGRQLASALAHAHAAGIVHRDVKPSNVILTPGEGLRLVDFGIACRSGSAGSSRGTRAWMSPEQLRGECTDARSDLWSLGAVLHALATGSPPPPPPSGPSAPSDSRALPALDGASDVPGPLEAAIRACLEPDPAARPTDARRVEAILGADAGGGANGAALRADGRGRRPRRGRLWVAGALAAAAVGLLVAIPAGWVPGLPGITRATSWAPDLVLVLPLEDRTGDTGLAEIGAMAADWLTEGVAREGTGRTIPSTTAMLLAAESRDPVVLASSMGAGVVVTGSYYLDLDSIRFAVSLVSGRTGMVLRALDPVTSHRSGVLEGIQRLRDVVVGAVAFEVEPRMTQHERRLVDQPPPLDAYLPYIRGKEFFIHGRWAEALQLMDEAEARAPDFLMPIFLGALAEANMGNYGGLAERLERTRGLMDAADPLARLGVEFLEAILAGDHEASYRVHRQGVDDGILVPGTIGHAQLVQDAVKVNRMREAVTEARRADPARGELRGWYAYWAAWAHAHHALGEHRAELRVARASRESLPAGLGVLYMEGRALASLGRSRELERVLDEARGRHSSPPDFLRWMGGFHRINGREAEAMRLFREAIELARARVAEDPSPERRFTLAEALLATGDGDDAREAQAIFRELREALPELMDPLAGLGRAAAALGDLASAGAASDTLAANGPAWPFGAHTYRRARIAARAGQVEAAVALLRQAAREGSQVYFNVHTDWEFMQHRRHPSMASFLRPR